MQINTFSPVHCTTKLSDAITVRRCVASIFLNNGDVWPNVIEAILDGRLPVKGTAGAVGLEDLYVGCPDTWVDFLNNAQGFTETDTYPLSSPEVAFYLDMSLGAAQTMFNFKRKLSLRDLREFRNEKTLLDHLSCIAAIKSKPMSVSLIYRRLDAAGLRSPGDRFVDRTKALRLLGLD